MATPRESIAQVNRTFVEAFGKGDTAGVAALYTREGQLLPPASDAITGHPGIEAFWSGAREMGIAAAQLETVELDHHHDTAIEIGRYTLRTADDVIADEGKYVVVWKLEDASWKLHRDIWNTSRG